MSGLNLIDDRESAKCLGPSGTCVAAPPLQSAAPDGLGHVVRGDITCALLRRQGKQLSLAQCSNPWSALARPAWAVTLVDSLAVRPLNPAAGDE